MDLYLYIAIGFSALSFLFFGYACLTAPLMVMEFERYGLSQYRVLNGYLQLVGALALLLGFFYSPLWLLGSAGLGLLMFLGLLVRIRLKDGFVKSFPAFFYMLLNVFIFWTAYQS